MDNHVHDSLGPAAQCSAQSVEDARSYMGPAVAMAYSERWLWETVAYSWS